MQRVCSLLGPHLVFLQELNYTIVTDGVCLIPRRSEASCVAAGGIILNVQAHGHPLRNSSKRFIAPLLCLVIVATRLCFILNRSFFVHYFQSVIINIQSNLVGVLCEQIPVLLRGSRRCGSTSVSFGKTCARVGLGPVSLPGTEASLRGGALPSQHCSSDPQGQCFHW